MRSKTILDNLKRRAREMGCDDADAEMTAFVTENYSLTAAPPLACPQQTMSETLNFVKGTCPGCEAQANQYNQAVADILRTVEEHNRAVTAFNAMCESDNRRHPLLLESSRRVTALKQQHAQQKGQLGAHRQALIDCERRECAKISIRNSVSIRGNNPYDPRDPIAEDAQTIGGLPQDSSTDTSPVTTPTSPTSPGTSSPAPVPMVAVTGSGYDIPVSRLILVGPDACPTDHYHGNANDCNGVFRIDPAPGVCGHGAPPPRMIPESSCPDL